MFPGNGINSDVVILLLETITQLTFCCYKHSDRTTSKSSADVIILTQDNRHISAATLSKIKNITKSLVRRLDQSSNITLRYAWGTYASRSGVSDFVSKTAVTSLVDNYTHGSSGKVNFLKGALDRVKIKLSNITGNQAKVSYQHIPHVIFVSMSFDLNPQLLPRLCKNSVLLKFMNVAPVLLKELYTLGLRQNVLQYFEDFSIKCS